MGGITVYTVKTYGNNGVNVNLYIVRHGETNLNKDKIMQGQSVYSFLDTQGQLEAKAIAKRLKNIDFKHIYVSDLNRTHQTADFIFKELEHKPEITYTKVLRERNKGKFEIEFTKRFIFLQDIFVL